MSIKNLFVILIAISLFTGCAVKKGEEVVDMSTTINYEQQVAAYESKFKKYKKIQKENTKSKTFENYTTNKYISKKTTINDNLYDFYSEWEGVRYKMGGESKKGIDCSAFIQKAFKEKFAMEMPRTTTLQSKMGKEISKNELEMGDLVFFRINKRLNHVGIYIEDGKFMHASTSSGVTISDLNSEYFLKRYWKAQRVMD
ncbi:MAG: NlpC/P60 family protein [Aliarcobacter sp.]